MLFKLVRTSIMTGVSESHFQNSSQVANNFDKLIQTSS
jgi:hypothetical protein